jgi:pyrroline-5-carboxylate reductase
MPNSIGDILLVGCGRMGSALVERLIATHHVLVYDPFAPAPDGTSKIESLSEANIRLSRNATIVLAIKPQAFAGIAPLLVGLATAERRIVSIIAGIRIAQMQSMFGSATPLFRAMPNTPVAVGAGATAIIASAAARQEDSEVVQSLFESVGRYLWLDQEGDLDLVTALSGSGPAYFFRFTEALAKAATGLGLDRDAAEMLARQTMVGAARLAETQLQPLSSLREQVTSPGGTTAAALAVMNCENAIDVLAHEMLQAAMLRSRELGQALD